MTDGRDADGLGRRGRELWDDTVKACDGERGRVLLLEACRIADRLDVIDELIEAGDTDVLAEARQQAGMMRAILTTLPVKGSDDADAGGSWLDDMSAPVRHPSG